VGAALHPAGAGVTRLAVQAALLLLAPAATGPAPAQPISPLVAAGQDIRFRDRVDVESVVVDARVVDGAGRPILGLTPSDFRLKVDGRAVPVQSVSWVDDSAPPDPEATVAAGQAGVPLPPRGRLIVFFFQKDLESSRVMGFLQMLRRARTMLDGLGEQDRVAVVSFDSHLKVWTDFTTDRERLRHVLDRSILFERVPLLAPGDAPSLVEHLEPGAGRRAAAPETALLQLGEALKELPGAKSLVLFGWGMGRWSPGVGVFLESDYGPARRALVEGRVTVFALDVTSADYHTLEVGLEQVAEDTGGFYAKTHLFPGQALARLEHALAGHYVLTFTKPDLPRGEHAIDLDLVRRKGSVLARPSYEG
jgi:VWFA-related protein